MRRRTLLATAMAVCALVLVACSRDAPSALEPRGDEARHLAGVWWLMFGLAAGVYAIVGGFIIVALLRGRGTAQGRRTRLSENGLIWGGGIIGPVLILGVLAVVTVKETRDVRQSRPGALRIEVVGKRWWWAVRYPDDRVTTANEIHIPVGKPVRLTLRSDNVVHSFWVPELAGKVDMIPGQPNVFTLTAERAGTYLGECAEFCGLQHARMRFLVVADPVATFDRWLTRQQAATTTPQSDQAARGELVFMREACAGCHTIRGTQARGVVGPDLSDIGGRRFIGANTAPNQPGFLAGWISNSQTIKPGNLMPPITLEARDLDDLVVYLEGLK